MNKGIFMKDKITNGKKLRCELIALFSIILLICSLLFAFYDYKLKLKAITIEALITEIDYSSGSVATISYDVEDESYTKKINVSSSLATGDYVKITYDMYNPSHFINNKYYIYIYLGCLVISFLLMWLYLAKAWNFILRDSFRSKVKKNGYVVDAVISEVIVDNTFKMIKGSYPYKIRAKFLNRTNNMEYVYESDSVYINLANIISKYRATTVKVYLDKTNTYNYYVDLSSLVPNIPIIDPSLFMNPKKKEEDKHDEVVSNEEVETKQEEK